MDTIRLQGMTVEGDIAVIYYGKVVGRNSIARCSIEIPVSKHNELTGDKLINFIKKEEGMEDTQKKPNMIAGTKSAIIVGSSSFWVRLWNLISNPFRYLFTGELHY